MIFEKWDFKKRYKRKKASFGLPDAKLRARMVSHERCRGTSRDYVMLALLADNICSAGKWDVRVFEGLRQIAWRMRLQLTTLITTA